MSPSRVSSPLPSEENLWGGRIVSTHKYICTGKWAVETATEVVKVRFFREGFTCIFDTKDLIWYKDFWWLKEKKKEKEIRNSSAKIDQNVHNLETRKAILAQNSRSCLIFYYCVHERNILGSIHKGAGGSHVACSTLGNLIHNERELGPQLDLSPFCLRLWFGMAVGMTAGLVTTLHMFPPLCLLQQWSMTICTVTLSLESRMALAEKSLGKKNVPDCFFTLIQMGYYSGSWHTWVRRQ